MNAIVKGKPGFTLIEILLASAILGVSATVILVAASRCLAVMRTAAKYERAAFVMGSSHVDFPMIATNDVMGLAVSPVEYPGGYMFSREVEEDEDEDTLFVVRCRVAWSDRGHGMIEEVVRYVRQVE